MKQVTLPHFYTGALATLAVFFVGNLVFAQQQTYAPDLAAIPPEQGWKLVNRSATVIDKDETKAIRLEGKGRYGFAQLTKFTFTDGIIEFDARGKNVLQQSFLGIAFHGSDAMTYDAVYFRPFNFRTSDPLRRLHAVQYIAHPTFTWEKLRNEHPGHYEKPIAPAPDPDGWFHVRVVIETPRVSVFVNNTKEPNLVVTMLNDRKDGWLGLWTDISGGDFANLQITPTSKL